MPLSNRKFPRVKTQLGAKAKPTTHGMFEGQVLNLSEGGLFLATAEKIGVGNQVMVTLTFDLNGREKSCLVSGKVAWCNKDEAKGPVGWGIEFRDCPASVTKLIQEYVKLQLGNEDASATATAKSTRGQLRG